MKDHSYLLPFCRSKLCSWLVRRMTWLPSSTLLPSATGQCFKGPRSSQILSAAFSSHSQLISLFFLPSTVLNCWFRCWDSYGSYLPDYRRPNASLLHCSIAIHSSYPISGSSRRAYPAWPGKRFCFALISAIQYRPSSQPYLSWYSSRWLSSYHRQEISISCSKYPSGC